MSTFSLSSTAAAQDDFPVKNIKILHGFLYGGAADILAHRLAIGLQAALGQTVVVEARAGAGGSIAARQVMRAPADGYTLFLSDSGQSIAYQMQADPEIDPRVYTALGLLGSMSFALVVSRDDPVKNVGELVAFLSANPGRTSYGTPGPWTIGERSGHAFARAAGVKAQPIAYKGGAQMLTDLVQQRLQFGFISLPLALDQARGGYLKILAVTSQERSRLSPETPTLAETFAGFHVVSNIYLFGPPRMEAVALRVLRSSLQKLAVQPQWRLQLAAMGFTPEFKRADAVASVLEIELRGRENQPANRLDGKDQDQ